jgi:hypothetical protein
LQPSRATDSVVVSLESIRPEKVSRSTDIDEPVVTACVFNVDAVNQDFEYTVQHFTIRTLHSEGNLAALMAKPESVEESLPRWTFKDLVLLLIGGHKDLL